MAKTKPLLRTEEHWNHNFRCSQIICGCVNDIIGTVLMPGQFVFIMIVTVVTLVGLVKNPASDPMLQTVEIVILFSSLMYFISFVGYGSTLLELSYKLLERRKYFCRTKYMKAFRNSCYPFKAKIGSFMYLERSTILSILSTVINYTVILLLL